MSELPPAAAAAAAAAGGPSGSPAAATAAMAAELQDLFAYVQRYTPVEFTLDTRLQPFIPDFVPRWALVQLAPLPAAALMPLPAASLSLDQLPHQ